MSEHTCSACGREMAAGSTFCVDCGARAAPKWAAPPSNGFPLWLKLLVTAGGVLVLIMLALVVVSSGPSQSDRAAAMARVDSSPKAQTNREMVIARSESDGILEKVDGNGMWVEEGFYGLPVDEKRQLAEIILTYRMVQDPSVDQVTIWDAYSGEIVGSISLQWGFDLHR
jgi:hypothetical protein